MTSSHQMRDPCGSARVRSCYKLASWGRNCNRDLSWKGKNVANAQKNYYRYDNIKHTMGWFFIFGYMFQEPRGKYTLLDQNGGHLLVHHTSTYDTYKKYICKTEHKLTGIRRRSLQPARLILTGKYLFSSFLLRKEILRLCI